MDYCLIKGAKVKSPNGEFWLFEDSSGEIKGLSEAMDFMINAKSLFDGPLVLLFQQTHGDFQAYGDGPFASFASTLRREDVDFQPVFVSPSKRRPNLN